MRGFPTCPEKSAASPASFFALSPSDMVLKLVIKVSSGNTIPIEVEPSMKVLEVKELIATKCDVPANQQVLCAPNVPAPPLRVLCGTPC